MYRTLRLSSFFLLIAFPPCLSVAADERDELNVGLQADGRIVVPTNQILQPAGKQVTFAGRPVDVLLIEAGKTVVAKNMRNLVFIDRASGTIKQILPLTATKGLASAFSAVGLLERGERLYASDSQGAVRIAKRTPEGNYDWEGHLALDAPEVGGAPYPTGMAWHDDGHLWVCSSRGNELQLLNTSDGRVVARVPVGVAPYAPVVVGDRVYVSNWGGDPPPKDADTLTTSGTPVKIDPRTNVANTGSVSIVAHVDGKWAQTGAISVGGHPSGIASSPNGKFVYVANANSDTVSVISTEDNQVVETIDCKPEAKLPFGTGSNAVALSADGQALFVANGTGNCVAVVALGFSAGGDSTRAPAESHIEGLIPTGWYPGAVQLAPNGQQLFVANVKGHGSLEPRKEAPRREGKGDGDDPAAPQSIGRNSHDHLGSVSLIDLPDAATLRQYTETVNANNRLGYSLAGMEPPRAEAKPVPVPLRHGEPSVFEHVIYVIKENRTYDQVLGDMPEGNGDASLCIFGEEVTPNQHKLAREFVLLDNFYCSGVLSADGHSWANAAYATDYLEKQFGQFTRSYPYEGSDPLAFPVSGFLWDNALAHRKSFRNYGEFVKSSYQPKNARWADVYADFVDGTQKVQVTATPNLRSLDAYTHPNFPGFPLVTPDVYRAKLFIDELHEYEKKGEYPNLVYLFLPADHTNGTRPNSPTPRAMVADNDLALGMVVEAVSNSRFWPKTCILVTEDDPQNGFDHVDGHRTVGLAISPYTKRKTVDSTCYNQTGLVKTIELILGLPPMTQLDLSATPMRSCFQDEPDLTPYQAVKNRIPLDEMNKEMAELDERGRRFARQSLELDLEEEDRADEETFNRILWYSVRGTAPYPGD
ncbi:MAG: bifunctional YncE family protein/alkaline phosphatase family protein [Pirellulales bacterium]|nr:bifunctional YncE family protein/alkaline phosphatase family protein [Pirellulales bacterium]